MDDYVHEYNEVNFPFDEENDYPSFCDENIDHLEKKYITNDLVYIFHDES